MKKEIAMLWADELESGRWTQAVGCLKDGGSYCCLGILCEISKPLVKNAELYSLQETIDNRRSLPEMVMDACGVKSRFGRIKSIQESLDLLNDEGKTFPEIADIIREHWEEL